MTARRQAVIDQIDMLLTVEPMPIIVGSTRRQRPTS